MLKNKAHLVTFHESTLISPWIFLLTLACLHLFSFLSIYICIYIIKSECPFRYKKAIINNLISYAKLISSSKTIFYKELESIKQALINNGFPNYIIDEQIKHMIKNVNQQNKHCTTPHSQQTYQTFLP